MPATPDDLAAFLRDLGMETTTVTHPPLHTVEESQALRGEIPGAHTKNLFLKDKKDALFLVVAPEDAAIDLKRLHQRIGAAGRLSFGRAELLARRAWRVARLGDAFRPDQRRSAASDGRPRRRTDGERSG